MLQKVTPQQSAQISSVRHWFGLDRGSAMILLSLYSEVGRSISRERLAYLARISKRSVRQRISEIRTTLEAEAIDTTADGYALTEVGVRECRLAFASMVADLVELAA